MWTEVFTRMGKSPERELLGLLVSGTKLLAVGIEVSLLGVGLNGRLRVPRQQLLTPAADTNKHEQQRSRPDPSERSADAQGRLVDVGRPL